MESNSALQKDAEKQQPDAWDDRVANLRLIKARLSLNQQIAIRGHIRELERGCPGLVHFLRQISTELAAAWTEWDSAAWEEAVRRNPPKNEQDDFITVIWQQVYLCILDMAAKILLERPAVDAVSTVGETQ